VLRHGRTAAVLSLLLVTFLAHTHLPKLGSEFMPSLNEGSILDMPTTAPRVAMGQAIDDVMVRDRVLASFPEVAMVVGKIGRADTATDPSPLDMVETIVTMQPTDWWPKRKMEFRDVLRQGGAAAAALQRAGYLQGGGSRPEDWPEVARAVSDAEFLKGHPQYTQPVAVLNTAASVASEKFDADLRDLARRRQREYEPELARALDQLALDLLVVHIRTLPPYQGRPALLRDPTAAETAALLAAAQPQGLRLVEVVRAEEVDHLLANLRGALVERGIAAPRDDLLLDPETWFNSAAQFLRRALGSQPLDFARRVQAQIESRHEELVRARLQIIDWELRDRAPGIINDYLVDRLVVTAHGTPLEGSKADAAALRRVRDELTPALAQRLFLWRKTKDDVLKEIDSELQMPGWGNAWTQPIINRVNMLATGVRTQIGVKVFGPTGKPLVRFGRDPKTGELVDTGAIADVQRISEAIAAKLKTINGAVDVIPDQAVGKRYLEITIDREKAARFGVNMADLAQVVETALGGGRITTTIEGRQRFPVRLRYTRENWQNLEDIRNVLVNTQMTPVQLLEVASAGSRVMPAPAGGMAPKASAGGMGGDAGGLRGGAPKADKVPAPAAGSGGGTDLSLPAPGSNAVQIPLNMVADIRIVEGPSMIKSENGRLRNYVTLNVRGRDLLGFVEEAKQAVKPIEAQLAGTGMSIAWSGEYEAQVRANQTLAIIFPMVIMLILFLLYVTFHDLHDTLLAFLAVLGALSGAIMFQAFFGFNRSVIVSIGYISAFGMATETAVIMLVYLREALDRHGGLAGIQTLEELRQCVITGAVHRLRPKLLTEGVAIVGLVPMLWAHGTGAEVMRPMAAPVLGGLLISDEVIDIMIPVLFYWVRRKRWLQLHQPVAVPSAGAAVPAAPAARA